MTTTVDLMIMLRGMEALLVKQGLQLTHLETQLSKLTKVTQVAQPPVSQQNLKNVSASPKKTKKKAFTYDREHAELAEDIFRYVNGVVDKKAFDLDKWADEVRKMEQIDKIRLEDIRSLLPYIYSDEFWRTNILSPKKLRQHWEKLKAKLKPKLTVRNMNLKKQTDYYKEKKW